MGNKCVKPLERQPQQQPVFDSRDGCVYRIPALCYNRNSKTLLAFAEKRKTLNDSDAEKLVMKTGTLEEDDTNGRRIQWSEIKEVENAVCCCHRTMNPCPVYDDKNNKLYLFFICVKNFYSEMWQRNNGCNKARLCYITTTDDGENWSALTDLTDLKQCEISCWATFAVGPGHGLQTKSDRLIVPVYAYPNKPGSSSADTSYAVTLYADKPYTEWQFGNMLENESGECEMAEVLDDKGHHVVYCNARSTKGHRVEAVSHNGGVDFSNQTKKSEMLVETPSGCQGSVVSFPAQSEDPNKKDKINISGTWLLLAHPTHLKERVNLGVYLNKSPQDPNKWSKPWIIKKGTSGYSDLVYIGKGQFLCLMECGERKELNQISSVMFSYSQVEQGIGQ